jgi:putative two-component system response regulator
MNKRVLLIVDDEENIINSLKRELRREGYAICAADSAEKGLELLNEQDIGVVLSDRIMPGMDGIEFLGMVKEKYPDIVRILLTGKGTLKSAMASINYSQIFSYLTKPWNSDELKRTILKAFEHYFLLTENKRLQRLTKEQNEELTRMNLNLENSVNERTMQLQESIREGIIMLATAAEVRDDNTGDHIYRIRKLTREICEGMRFSPSETEAISFFSMMHDVGKIHIPDSILLKPEVLTQDEFEIMRTHTVIGEKILGNKPFYRTAREIARSHHEHWDGTGYPDKLKGDLIPLPARITAIADVFDALTHDRHYKTAWPVTKAINDMKMLSGRQFDPSALDAFIRIHSRSTMSG